LKDKKNEEIRFEDALDRLEDIINNLQDGNLPLEESLKKFEEGVSLVRMCQKKLDDAETKVSLLIKDEKGGTVETSFDVESGE
jgi:exodeoxyribonuclease VII small subunit